MRGAMQTEAELNAAVDYYETLQVSPKAEPEVIEAAYKRLALKYHPDLNATPEATRRMQELNAAYAVLSNPERRAEYDQERAPLKSGRQARYVRRRRPKPEPKAPARPQPRTEEATEATPHAKAEAEADPQAAEEVRFPWEEEAEAEAEYQAGSDTETIPNREWVIVDDKGPRWKWVASVAGIIIALALIGLLVFGSGQAANGEAENAVASQKIILPPNVIFDDDFDTVAGANWLLNGPWHLTTRRAASGTHSLWVGDETRNSYKSNLNATATLARPVDLSNTQNPLLRFRLNGQFDSETLPTGNDKLLLEVAEPGRDFETAYTISANYSSWQDLLVDLSKWKGKIVTIRFRFISSPTSLGTYTGPFLDDIRIER